MHSHFTTEETEAQLGFIQGQPGLAELENEAGPLTLYLVPSHSNFYLYNLRKRVVTCEYKSVFLGIRFISLRLLTR